MRIGVNTRLLLSGKMDGIGWFANETLKRLVLNHPEHDFYFFFDRKYDPCFVFGPNVHPVVLCPQARHPVLWYLFFQISIKRALKRYNIDLFLSPDGYLPLGTDVPTLTVIHDINFEHSKDFLKPSHQRYMTYFFPQFARYSTRIATVSEFSKQDISTVYNIQPEKIDVVYDGAYHLTTVAHAQRRVAVVEVEFLSAEVHVDDAAWADVKRTVCILSRRIPQMNRVLHDKCAVRDRGSASCGGVVVVAD